MITDAFDKSEVLFGPKDFYGEQKHLCDKCIIVFSELIFEYMLETYAHEEAGVIRCCNGITTVYIFEIEGMKIASYLSHIGSALAGGDVIDVNWLTGAGKFIMFGSAGSLDSNLTNGKFVIPTASYREEGCVAVEMELAGVQAVCDFYGWDLYDFLVTGDVLDQAVYDVSELSNANHNMDKLYIAIEIAKRI